MKRTLGSVLACVCVMSWCATARADLAIVFDPPSNVRDQPNGGAVTCSISQRNREIRIFEESTTKRGWFATDVCGRRGWIHKGQFKVFTRATVKSGGADVRASRSASATIQCKASGGVRVLGRKGQWSQTDYCGQTGWIRTNELDTAESVATPALSTAIKNAAKFAPSCTQDFECQNAGTVPECADALSGHCVDKHCYYTHKSEATCPCWDGEVRTCPTANTQFNYCLRQSTNLTAWDTTCGPTVVSCDPHRLECTSGTATTSFDGTSWKAGVCTAAASCPQDGKVQECPTGNPQCPKGVQTFSLSSGWSTCSPQNGCPTPAVTTTTCAGKTETCQVGGCTGTKFCDSNGVWGACVAKAQCPTGWSWDGGQCTWTSPHQGEGIKYYPHKTPNDSIAATADIGAPIAGGSAGPIYVEVTLSQWSNPPANGGGNHCGKGDFRSTWVGCIHPDNQLGYGRDVVDSEWEKQTMIPLRCEPGDRVGIKKYSWGHDASWHCSRQANLGVVRNHDGIQSCTW